MAFKELIEKAVFFLSAKKNQFNSKLIMVTGFIFGLVIASIVIHYTPVIYSDLEKAKKLGIISLTILAGYPKSQDTLYYIIGFFITLLTSISFWFVWIILSSKNIDGIISNNQKFPVDKKTTNYFKNTSATELIIILIVILILTYNNNFFYSNWFNHYTFFSEEGQHLSYANDILHGKQLYKDIYAIYGPLMEYPLAILMKVLGKSILTLRIYTYLLDIIGFLLIYFLSKEIFSRKSTVIISMLIFLSFYTPLFPAPNGSILRVTLALFGIFPFSRYINTKKSMWAVISGFVLSLSLFFSHETAICMAISFACMLFASKFISEPGDRNILEGFYIPFLTGFCALAIPMTLFFLYKGTLFYYLKASISYPQYVSLGFGGISFPNFISQIKTLLNNPTLKNVKDTFFVYAVYWPILLYFGISIHISITAIFKKVTHKKVIILGILVYGITLFKGALARAGIDRNYLLLPPALFLALFYGERILLNISNLIKTKAKEKIGVILLYSCFFIFIAQGIISYAIWPAHWCIEYFFISNINKIYNLNYNSINDMVVLKIPRSGNISLPEGEAEKVKAVVEYVRKHLAFNDYIFVFPNDATYYFLIDRPMPARFGVLHDAATTGLKEEVIKYLEEKKPKFIISNVGEWQVDKISEEIEFPQILKYINNNYHFERDIYGVKILRKN